MKKRTIILSFTFIISSIVFSQTTDFNHQIGISVKASTNGIGADIYYRPFEKFAIKAGGEYISFNIKNKTLEHYLGDAINVTIPNPRGNDLKFNSDAMLKTGALTLAIGYQPLKLLYFTFGLGKNLFESEVTGTPKSDITFESQDIPGVGTISPKISKENIGNFNITINPSNTIIPYVGIGLGSYVPSNKSFSFALELGAYYVGKYSLKANMPLGFDTENIDYGTSSFTQEQKDQFSERINDEINIINRRLNSEINNAINEINKTIEPYRFYPVLKLTIGFRAFEFKK